MKRGIFSTLALASLGGLLTWGLPSAASEPPEYCAERWSLRGVTVGAPIEAVGEIMSANDAKRLGSDDRDEPMIWEFQDKVSRGERLVVYADVEGRAVRAVMSLVSKPAPSFPKVLEEYGSRWGEPELHRHVVGNDRADRLTEASVWVDRDCDVKATVLGIKERTGAGFRFLKFGVRVERAVDRIGHLQPLRDQVRRQSGR